MNSIIFPGSFDPFHAGHKYVVDEILKKFDFVYIVVSWNENKKRHESFEESKNKIESIFKNYKNVKVIINKNKLTAEIANDINCFNIVRGIRNNHDFIFEEKLKNQYISSNNKINVYYVFSNDKYKNLSSSFIKKTK